MSQSASAGNGYDPTSHCRAARVFDFFGERGLTPEFLRTVYLHQTILIASLFDELGLPDSVATRDRETPLDHFGGFLAIETADAERVSRRPAAEGVSTDSRSYLRLGPAPYHLRCPASGGDAASRRRALGVSYTGAGRKRVVGRAGTRPPPAV